MKTMEEKQRETVDKCLIQLVDDVIPKEMLPYLPCLTDDDKQAVQCRQEHEGSRAAVSVLLDRLKKRSGSFQQFLKALECTGCQHLKKLLMEVSRGERLKLPQSEEVTTKRLQSQFSLPSEETDCSEFDVLVCYAQKDKDVAYEMRNAMMEYNLRVCIDEVDFIPGHAFSENICNFVSCSKTIVFLLTTDFLEKKWSHWEMEHALLDSLDKKASARQKKIIPVLLKKCEIPNALRPYTPLDFQESKDWKRLANAVQESHGTDTSSDITKDTIQEAVVPSKLAESS